MRDEGGESYRAPPSRSPDDHDKVADPQGESSVKIRQQTLSSTDGGGAR
jgi:hypothetical protein